MCDTILKITLALALFGAIWTYNFGEADPGAWKYGTAPNGEKCWEHYGPAPKPYKACWEYH